MLPKEEKIHSKDVDEDKAQSNIHIQNVTHTNQFPVQRQTHKSRWRITKTLTNALVREYLKIH